MANANTEEPADKQDAQERKGGGMVRVIGVHIVERTACVACLLRSLCVDRSSAKRTSSSYCRVCTLRYAWAVFYSAPLVSCACLSVLPCSALLRARRKRSCIPICRYTTS